MIVQNIVTVIVGVARKELDLIQLNAGNAGIFLSSKLKFKGVNQMDNTGTITIPIDEYFNLRTKAEAHAYMSGNIESFRAELERVHHRLYEIESENKKLSDKVFPKI